MMINNHLLMHAILKKMLSYTIIIKLLSQLYGILLVRKSIMLWHLCTIGMLLGLLLSMRLFRVSHLRKLRNGLLNLKNMPIIRILLSILPAINPIWRTREGSPRKKLKNLPNPPGPSISWSLPRMDPISTSCLGSWLIKFMK